MTVPHSLLVRPDAGSGVGAGHVARCYALAEAWVARGGDAVVWCDGTTSPWEKRFGAIGVGVSAACPTVAFDWVAVDGYRFTPTQQQSFRQLGERTLSIDDYGLGGQGHFDLVVDQNPAATAGVYDARRVLVGPRYAAIRAEFRAARPAGDSVTPIATRVALLGGGSPSSAAREFLDGVRAALEDAGLEAVDIVDQTAVAATLATADLAVSAAGSTALELSCLGVPQVLFVVADNQRRGAVVLDSLGIAVHAGELPGITPDGVTSHVARLARDAETRHDMRAKALQLVDGLGASRTVTAMLSTFVRLRPAAEEDAHDLLEWRNDPTTRRWSFSDQQVDWDEHTAWLQRQLSDPDTRLLIVEDDAGRAIGQLRFDLARSTRTAEVSVGLAAEARGHGLAAPVIDAGIQRLFADTDVEKVIARIKPGNAASIKSFVQADFDPDVSSKSGDDALLYSRSHDANRV